LSTPNFYLFLIILWTIAVGVIGFGVIVVVNGEYAPKKDDEAENANDNPKNEFKIHDGVSFLSFGSDIIS
jgi:hypothetical protein